ncbi:MAG: EAL domain-containing protein [Rhodospirillaceae bacterium]|nr:EAL domain-containing protein [Rhodospirillaceae bacterium]
MSEPSRAAARRHTIRLEDLIVHKYSERAALMKKADKIARRIFDEELREGESYRIAEDGVYLVLLPRLTPEAGALRCSLLAEHMARAIRKVNPAAAQFEKADPQNARPRSRVHRRITGAPASKPVSDPISQEAATRAFERMIDVGQAAPAQELALTDSERLAMARMSLSFHPVWHVRNKLITGYRCALSMNGQDLSLKETAGAMNSDVSVVTKAKIDAMIYANAVAGVQGLLQTGQKALLVVPIHFSTLDHMRYIAPLLEAGGPLPADAQSLIVFELLEIPQKTSHFRLREPTSYLRTRSRALLARIGFDFSSLDAFRELNFHGISIDLGDYPWSESQLLPFFDAFTLAAGKQKLHPFVHGIRSASLTVAAISSGFSYIGGPAVAAPLSAPETVHSFAVESLYRRG